MANDIERRRDRPAHEIEITPEMIEAGVSVLVSYDPRLESEDDFILRFLLSVLPKSGITALCPKRFFQSS